MDALNNEAAALFNLGRSNESITVSDRALAIDPKNVDLPNTKALELLDLGKFNESITVSDRALVIDPIAMEESNQAIASFDKVLAIDPNNTEALDGKRAH